MSASEFYCLIFSLNVCFTEAILDLMTFDDKCSLISVQCNLIVRKCELSEK